MNVEHIEHITFSSLRLHYGGLRPFESFRTCLVLETNISLNKGITTVIQVVAETAVRTFLINVTKEMAVSLLVV